MHTELSVVHAVEGDARLHDLQLTTLRPLLRRLHLQQISADPTPGAIAARDLYLASASAQLAVGAIQHANTLLVEYFATEMRSRIALRSGPRAAEYDPRELGLPARVKVENLIAQHLAPKEPDERLMLLAACAQEALAGSLRQSARGDPRERIGRALSRSETFLRAALELRPSSREAQLRLGWRLVVRGDADAARPLLEAVARAEEDGARSHLAWLFLGRLYEQSGDSAASLDAFERAAEIAPGAFAARLSLAIARERREGYAAARDLLREFLLAARTAEAAPEPWSLSGLGPEELRLHPLQRLRARVRAR